MKRIRVKAISDSNLSKGTETTLYETKEELMISGLDPMSDWIWGYINTCGVVSGFNGETIVVTNNDSYTILEDYPRKETLPEKWILEVDKITPSIEKYLIDEYGEVDGYIKRRYENETFSLFSPSDYRITSPNYVTQNEELIETYLHDYTPITLQEFNKVYGFEEDKKELLLSSIEEKLDEMNTVFDHIIKLGNDKLQKTVEVNKLLGEIKDIDSSIEEQKVSIGTIKEWFSINGIKVD